MIASIQVSNKKSDPDFPGHQYGSENETLRKRLEKSREKQKPLNLTIETATVLRDKIKDILNNVTGANYEDSAKVSEALALVDTLATHAELPNRERVDLQSKAELGAALSQAVIKRKYAANFHDFSEIDAIADRIACGGVVTACTDILKESVEWKENIDKKLDGLLEFFNAAFLAGQFELANLALIMMTEFFYDQDGSVIVGVISATYPAASKLPFWKESLARARSRMTSLIGLERTNNCLKGFEEAYEEKIRELLGESPDE